MVRLPRCIPFVKDYIQPGAKIITDAWQGYRGLEKLGFIHERRRQRAAQARGEDPGELLPAVHRVASFVQWVLTVFWAEKLKSNDLTGLLGPLPRRARYHVVAQMRQQRLKASPRH